MTQWLLDHGRSIGDSLLYALLGTIILVAGFWLTAKTLPFSMRKEIEEDQNISLAIILGAFILGISIIIASAIH